MLEKERKILSQPDLYDTLNKMDELEDHERCFFMRRRVGYTQQQVADDLQCCRRWVNLMERGLAPVDDLLWYWEA